MPKREPAATSRKSDSHLLSRRDFVTRTSLIAAGLVVGPASAGCSDQTADVRSTAGTGSAQGLNTMKTRQLGDRACFAAATTTRRRSWWRS